MFIVSKGGMCFILFLFRNLGWFLEFLEIVGCCDGGSVYVNYIMYFKNFVFK